MPIRVRTDLWPLVVIDASGAVALADVRELEREIGAVYARRERFATLVDTSRAATLPDASVRKRLGDWQNETKDQIARFNVLTATVIRSQLVRGAMTAIHWIFRPPNEQIAVASVPEGLDRCVDALRAAGVAIPAALEAEQRKKPESLAAG